MKRCSRIKRNCQVLPIDRRSRKEGVNELLRTCIPYYTYYLFDERERERMELLYEENICIFFSHLVAYICIRQEYIKRLRE